MDSYDQYDILNTALTTANEYPANLLRSDSFEHDLKLYNKALQQHDSRLFYDDPDFPEFSGVKLFEAYDGCGKEASEPDKLEKLATLTDASSPEYGQLKRYRTVDELKSHFQTERKDPRCRHVFITSDHSRAPLDCSKEAFTYTLSFLQTMPQFLNLAFTFGSQVAENDFHYTAFNTETFLDDSAAKKHCIPRLGRSGYEIRHCFNLWSVENSESPPYWAIRQTAVYHSFDVRTGRSTWINIKGNELMQKRITQALGSASQLQPRSLKTASGAFSASLLTLLIVLEWSGENWKSRTNDLERQLSDVLMKAKNAPFKTIEDALSLDPAVLIQHLTATEATTENLPRRTDSAVSAKPPPRTDTLRSVLSLVTPKRILTGISGASISVDAETMDSPILTEAKHSTSPLKHPHLISPTLHEEDLNSGTVHRSEFSVLKEFTVDGLQKLADIASKLHEVKLVMKLNAEVINDMMDYYTALIESDAMPTDIKKGCAIDLNAFLRRARAVIRGLEMEQSRTETLMRMLEDGKWLFDNILQFRNIEINKLFAINAHQSGKHVELMTNDMHQSSIEMEAMTKSMKEVAEKTAIQTSSMHIITWVTLFFLPATFVATFFSSGAFQWDQNKPDESSMPFWKPEFFALFALICLPMTGIIILAWWAVYRRNSRMRREHVQGDEGRQQTV